MRKSRYTYDNIIEHKAFTINVPSESQIVIADYCDIVSGKNTDKFAAANITAVKSSKVDAPYINEFPMILECKLLSTAEIGIHTQFVAEILDVKIDEAIIGKDGLPDIEKINPPIYAPELRAYYGIGKYLGEAFAIDKKINNY